MNRFAALTVSTLTAGIVAVAPAASAAPVSSSIRFQNNSGKVTCGLEIHAPGKPATKVLCAAGGIPAPKQKGIGDPGFVQLGALGQPQVLRLSQDSFVAGKLVTLGRRPALEPAWCDMSRGQGHGHVLQRRQPRFRDRQRALQVVLTRPIRGRSADCACVAGPGRSSILRAITRQRRPICR